MCIEECRRIGVGELVLGEVVVSGLQLGAVGLVGWTVGSGHGGFLLTISSSCVSPYSLVFAGLLGPFSL